MKWNPTATLTSVEYNWPKISGSFLTPEECAHSYGEFARIHISHVDPICFRAAIFATLLAKWCREYHIIVDSNIFCSANSKFWMLLKMQYRATCWIWMIEAMCITHFITGAHNTMIYDMGNTRAKPGDRFVKRQRQLYPSTMVTDVDLNCTEGRRQRYRECE